MLSLVISNVNGECSYYSLYEKAISKTSSPGTLYKKPFGLVLAYGEDNVRTEQHCIDFCNSKKWCIATDDLSDYPNVPEFCQFITDWQLLEMDKTNKCTKDLNTFNCVLNQYVLLSIDNDVFRVVDIADTYGGHASEHIIPSNIVERSIGEGKFCHVLKTDNQVISTKSHVYSDYYTTSPILYKGWKLHHEIDSFTPKDMGDPNPFAKRGTSIGHGGYPIKGMMVTNHKPYNNAYDFETYTMLRNEFVEYKECSLDPPGTGQGYISHEETDDGETYFHFITSHEDGSEPLYLSCSVTDDDNAFACQWVETPTMVWRMASFRKTFGDDCNGCGGHDNSFIAYDINNLDNELGWLDRSHCDSDLDSNKDQLRILHGGKKSGQSSLHCGIGNWKLSRGYGDRDNLAKGHGSWLSRRNHYRAFAENDNVFAYVRGMHDSDPHSARLCGIVVHETRHNEHNCGGQTRYNSFRIESVPKAKDVNMLFSIEHDGLMLHCPRDDSNCKWVTDDDTTKQYFKFVNNGISQSTVNPLSDEVWKNNNIVIYQNINGFIIMVGYLRMNGLTQTFDITIGLTTSPNNHPKDSESTSITDFVLDNTKCITNDNGGTKLVIGTLNSDAQLKIATSAESSPSLVPLNVKGVLDSSNYQWITNSDHVLVDGLHMCPNGEYLHQVRCKADQQCRHADIGCVKPKTNCAIDTNSTKTIHELEEEQFTSCPDYKVVVGWNLTHIACQKLNINPQQPSGHTSRHFPPTGFITQNSTKATYYDQIDKDGKNWHGVPYQAIRPRVSQVDLWNYGRSCFLKFEYSNININGREASVQRINLAGLDKGARCSDEHNFISYISCQYEDDCRRGIEITCDVAPKCKMSGDVIKVRSPVGMTGGVCPYGTVMKGISCLHDSASPNEKGESIPCVEMELECATIEYDEHFNPNKPIKPSSNDNNSVKTILIGLGIGLPLIVVLGIVCLCCLPDNTIISPQDVPIQESARIREYEAVPIHDYGLRHRTTLSRF